MILHEGRKCRFLTPGPCLLGILLLLQPIGLAVLPWCRARWSWGLHGPWLLLVCCSWDICTVGIFIPFRPPPSKLAWLQSQLWPTAVTLGCYSIQPAQTGRQSRRSDKRARELLVPHRLSLTHQMDRNGRSLSQLELLGQKLKCISKCPESHGGL